MRTSDALVALIGLILVWLIYRAHRDPSFDLNLFDLIMQDGRASRLGVAFIVSLFVTSWILIRLTLDGKLTEGYFGTYGLMWITPIVAKLFAVQK